MAKKDQWQIFLNILSLCCMIVVGFGINILIGNQRGPQVLGIYNQCLAVYVVCNQLSSFGLHYSLLKYLADANHVRPLETARIFWSGWILSIPMGLIAALLVLILGPWIAVLLDSPSLKHMFPPVALAVFLFTFNKVALFSLNGLKKMEWFALGNSARYLITFLACVFILKYSQNSNDLAWMFVMAEVVIFPFVILAIARSLKGKFSFDADWIKKHFSFSLRAGLGGFLHVLNIRIDVLMLGFFMSDTTVGIYTIAGMACDGFLNLLYVLRNQMNPDLVTIMDPKQRLKILNLFWQLLRWLTPFSLLLSAVAVIIYPWFVPVLFKSNEFVQAQVPMAILLFCVAIGSATIPFSQILLQAGAPIYHTIYLISSVALTIVLNAILIPMWGMNGAAAATGLSFLLSTPVLYILLRKKIN